MVGVAQILQYLDELGRILANLSSLGRSLCRRFQRKLVASGPRPLSLALLQLLSQSVSGEASSALHLMSFQGLLMGSYMVISCSTSNLYQLAVDIVVTFKGVFSLTCLMMLKNEAG